MSGIKATGGRDKYSFDEEEDFGADEQVSGVDEEEEDQDEDEDEDQEDDEDEDQEDEYGYQTDQEEAVAHEREYRPPMVFSPIQVRSTYVNLVKPNVNAQHLFVFNFTLDSEKRKDLPRDKFDITTTATGLTATIKMIELRKYFFSPRYQGTFIDNDEDHDLEAEWADVQLDAKKMSNLQGQFFQILGSVMATQAELARLGYKADAKVISFNHCADLVRDHILRLMPDPDRSQFVTRDKKDQLEVVLRMLGVDGICGDVELVLANKNMPRPPSLQSV